MSGVISRPRKRFEVSLTQRSKVSQMTLTIAVIVVEANSEREVREMLAAEVAYLSKWQQIQKTKLDKTLPMPRRWIPLQWLQVPFIITKIRRIK